MLRNPLATSPMLRSARHSSELWVLRPPNTGIMATQHNSNSAIRSRNPTNAYLSRNGGKSRSLRTVCGPIKVLALWLDGPPYRRSRQHYGYMPRCVRQPLPRLRFVGWTVRSVEAAYPRRHVLYCLWNRLRPRPWSLLCSGRWNCDWHHIVSRIQSGSSWGRSLYVASEGVFSAIRGVGFGAGLYRILGLRFAIAVAILITVGQILAYSRGMRPAMDYVAARRPRLTRRQFWGTVGRPFGYIASALICSAFIHHVDHAWSFAIRVGLVTGIVTGIGAT